MLGTSYQDYYGYLHPCMSIRPHVLTTDLQSIPNLVKTFMTFIDLKWLNIPRILTYLASIIDAIINKIE